MKRLRILFVAPTALLTLATMAVPLAIVAVYSLMTRGAYGGIERPFSIENYVRLWDPLYAIIFLRSFWIAALSTVLCLVIGFQLALFLAGSGEPMHLSYA